MLCCDEDCSNSKNNKVLDNNEENKKQDEVEQIIAPELIKDISSYSAQMTCNAVLRGNKQVSFIWEQNKSLSWDFISTTCNSICWDYKAPDIIYLSGYHARYLINLNINVCALSNNDSGLFLALETQEKERLFVAASAITKVAWQEQTYTFTLLEEVEELSKGIKIVNLGPTDAAVSFAQINIIRLN